MSNAALNRIYALLSGLVLAFIVLPLGIIVWASFFANKILTFPPTGYTFDWYTRAWSMDVFREGFLVSIQTAVIATFISLLLGVPASLALVRYPFPGRDTIQSLFLSPMIVPGIVGGAALYIAFIELEILFDVQVAETLGGLLTAHALIAFPWTVRLVTASLTGTNRTVEEAAASLGAAPCTVFRRITLPAIRSGLIAAALFSFVISFIDLEKSLFLVGPGRTTLQIALVNYMEWNLDSTVAAVASVQILIICVLLVISDRYAKLSRVF